MGDPNRNKQISELKNSILEQNNQIPEHKIPTSKKQIPAPKNQVSEEISEIQPASQNHEKQLARLMELQRGFVRSTHIDTESLDLIKKKKKAIRTKQAAAEKRRELAKKAVEAQNDEEMFQALFE